MSNNPERPRNTPEWERARKRAKRRDQYRCQHCDRRVGKDGGDLHAHHIRPVKKGGSDDLENLTTLCNDCHWRLHRIERSSSDEMEHLHPELLGDWTPDDNSFRHPSLMLNQNRYDTLRYIKENGPVKRKEVIESIDYVDETVASAIVFLHGAGVIERVRRGVYEYVPNPHDTEGERLGWDVGP